MARPPGDSKIPVFSSNSKPLSSRLSRPLANFSNKVRAHLSSETNSKHRSPSTSIILGILGGPNSRKSSKSSRGKSAPEQVSVPQRPSRFFESLNVPELPSEAFRSDSQISAAHIGHKVCVAGQTNGVLRYVGSTEFDSGVWCGVELDGPSGLNDGTVRGVQYFKCPPQHGVLAPVSKVTIAEDGKDASETGLLKEKRNSAGARMENGWKDDISIPTEQNIGTESKFPSIQSISQISTPTPSSTNSGGVQFWEWTLGSQHSSSAGSLVLSVRGPNISLELSKHSSIEFDESLGILTPDQMADFTLSNETSLHRTPSSDDIQSLILLDSEQDKLNSKRSSLEMQCEDSYLTPIAQKLDSELQIQNNNTGESQNDQQMDQNEQQMDQNEHQMEQDVVKDLSEDTEMSDSHLSKKTSDLAMSVSYETGTETVSDFIRINRTPSLEDLPMDKVDQQKEETSTAGPSRHVLPPPFITSVTSIASLDNGYQGDGEWSRPGSRGADHSPSAHQIIKPKTMDPMTDSDFFTESDADMHEEVGAQNGSGTNRGDRRAQIIDGTLYGGVSGGMVNGSVFHPDQRFSQNTEEMDSSGIYSDLERKAEDTVSEEKTVVEVTQDEKDFSPEGSTRTVSSKSENSQRIPTDFTTLIMEQVNSIKSLAVNIPLEAVIINNWEEKNKNKTKTSTQTNTKVINTNKDENQENRRPVGRSVKTPRKGRWDAVMNKIAQGKADERSKPSRLKEVKSKVFAGISLTPPNTAGLQGTRKACSSRNLTTSQSISSASLRDLTQNKTKSRRSRTRGSEGSPATQNSSRNSSLSDVSISLQPQTTSTQSLRTSKKREPIRSSTPQSNDASTPASRPSTTPACTRVMPQKNGGVGVVQELKTSPSMRKPPSRRNFTPQTKPTPLRDLNRVPASSTIGGGKVGVEPTRRPQALPPLQASVSLDVATTELRQAALGVEALGVLVNYLVFNLDAFSTPVVKKELEKMRSDWLRTKLEMEELRVTYIRSEEEKLQFQRRLDEARIEIQTQNEQHQIEITTINNDHASRVKILAGRLQEATEMNCHKTEEIERLKQFHIEQMEELKKTAKAELEQKENELKTRLTSMMADYNDLKEQSRRMLDSMHSDKDVKLQATAGRCKLLEDEVESLRAVFELRSTELQELRKQNEILLQDSQQLPLAEQKITTLQARVEDLQLQLERKYIAEKTLLQEKRLLSESMQQESKQKERLSLYNEELQWKLKQSSEVVNVLASMSGVGDPLASGSLLIPHTPKKASYTDYIIGTPRYNLPVNSTPYPTKDTSPLQSPKVKAVVEKSDSVSWVVPMDESPEHIVSRLVRKAHSFRAVQSATPSPAHHCHTLPNPHKRQRCRKSLSIPGIPGSKPGRTRSFSFDSNISDVRRKCMPDWDEPFSPSSETADTAVQSDNEELFVVETVGEDRLHSFLDIGGQIDGEKLDVMGGEDFASPKSTSSSGGSEASIRSRRKENNLIDNEEIMMINRVDSLLSSLPKESAGEAMVSEDTSDNESASRDSEDDERYIF